MIDPIDSDPLLNKSFTLRREVSLSSESRRTTESTRRVTRVHQREVYTDSK